ncbi:MAG: hypothetical protein GQ579_04645 [Bacteroidales bacterium]|nr:hypothetical protein [Bacteroidales bacterium]
MKTVKTIMVILILALSSHLVFGQDDLFTLIRKIPVDDLGITGQIDACEFSKDNYYIIATDNHATAKVYIRETGEFVNQVKHIDIKNDQFERAGKINALGYSYDRKYFFTGINDFGLKLWDAETFTLVHHFYRTKEVDGATFSSDGKWLAIGAGNAVYVHKVSDFTLVHKIVLGGTAVNFVDFNFDNSLLAVSMNKGDVLIARTSDWKTVQRYSINTSAKRIYFSNDGTLYALSGRNQYCKIHLTSDGSVVANLINLGNLEMLEGDDYGDANPAIETLHWSADGNYIFTGGVVDGIMRVWRRSDWSLIGHIQAQEVNRQIEYIDVSSDNEVIAGGDEGVLYHYKFNPPAILEPFKETKEGSHIISFEAEDFDSNVPFGGTAWETQNVENASGKITMKALPNSGRDIYRDKFITFDPTKDAPKLDYRIDFPEAGKWYIWILGRGGYNDNMVHVGMFDNEVGSAKSINWGERSAAEFSWTNSNINKDGAPAFVHITNMGVHTINVVMQQDGVEIDKIILASDKDYDPSDVNGGKGPKPGNRGTCTD